MHTFEGTNGTRIHFNSDMSGNVILSGLNYYDPETDKNLIVNLNVNGEDLKDFAKFVCINEIIEKLKDLI